jgi:hypothetical protein
VGLEKEVGLTTMSPKGRCEMQTHPGAKGSLSWWSAHGHSIQGTSLEEHPGGTCEMSSESRTAAMRDAASLARVRVKGRWQKMHQCAVVLRQS